MNSLTTAKAASVRRARARCFRRGAYERGLKIIAGELENSDECIAIAQRIAGLLREHRGSGRGAKNRIEAEPETAAKDVFSLGGHGLCHVTLQAALMAVRLGSYRDCKQAPEVLLALLKFAGAK
jgi:hypothetical protein